ncbi:MAG: alpha/beta hydrolase fold domain-containing protein [Acidimicrobiales bacterium]
MSWPWVMLGVSVVGALFTFNAYWPRRGPHLLGPSFFAAWLTNELAPHHLAWQVVATAVLVRLGALDGLAGKIGVGLTIASWIGLIDLMVTAHQTKGAMERSLAPVLGEVDLASLDAPGTTARDAHLPLRQIVAPFLVRDRRVRRERDVVYGTVGRHTLRLDVFAPREAGAGRPVVIQIHGGAWVIGSKDQQGLPLLYHLASHGWVCFNVDYRLSPRATFPDHLVDLKRALAWIREHGPDYGADPSFVLATGGSAGGHLASLLALTANDPEYQPGFEEADTSVQACMPYYGVYDFTDRDRRRGRGHRQYVRFLRRLVMKVPLEEAPEAWAKASPLDRVRPDAPPFLVIHGSHDTLVPVGEARSFVERLRAVSRSPVLYAELPGAAHAFDIFPSIRTAHVIRAAARFAAWACGTRRSRAAPVEATLAAPVEATLAASVERVAVTPEGPAPVSPGETMHVAPAAPTPNAASADLEESQRGVDEAEVGQGGEVLDTGQHLEAGIR